MTGTDAQRMENVMLAELHEAREREAAKCSGEPLIKIQGNQFSLLIGFDEFIRIAESLVSPPPDTLP